VPRCSSLAVKLAPIERIVTAIRNAEEDGLHAE
jgi:hypothetical protein